MVYWKVSKEKELVKEYAKANNISEERALNIFARDIVGEGRPITSFRLSDIPKTITKYMQPSITGAMKYAKPLSDKTAPGQKSEKEIAAEMRSYFDYVKGGGGRVWANRCQTTVHRANYNWDLPYSLGQTVRVGYGDEVTLPGQETIVIDADFTEDKIPGCVITGVNPKLKDMQNFTH